MVTKKGALGRMRFIFRVPTAKRAFGPRGTQCLSPKMHHVCPTFSLVSQSSSHDLSHETALEPFLFLIFEYTNSPAGISHFGEHIGFEHCNNRNRLRLCMCTIHGRGGPAHLKKTLLRLHRVAEASGKGKKCQPTL